MVAGLEIKEEDINKELSLRKKVFGRSERAFEEADKIEILSGIINGKTIGSPICLKLSNKEKKFENESVPRPGHADLAGAMKYNFRNIHLVSERASARETAMRVAIGTIAKKFLSEFNVEFFSHTLMIGGIRTSLKLKDFNNELRQKRDKSDLYCIDEKVICKMKEKINEARKKGDTLGGISEILIRGLPPGIGSYVHYDKRLDYCLAGALMSIPSVKAVEIGEGILGSESFGSDFHDSISYNGKILRKTNKSGGIEGGVSNGETIILRLYVKPVPTLKNPLPSFDIVTKELKKAPYYRSDICVVPSIGIIGEAVSAWEIARLFLEKFGGDTLTEVKRNFNIYNSNLRLFELK
jgi:chorismate synthase